MAKLCIREIYFLCFGKTYHSVCQLRCSINLRFENSVNRPVCFLLSLEEWSVWFWRKKNHNPKNPNNNKKIHPAFIVKFTAKRF